MNAIDAVMTVVGEKNGRTAQALRKSAKVWATNVGLSSRLKGRRQKANRKRDEPF